LRGRGGELDNEVKARPREVSVVRTLQKNVNFRDTQKNDPEKCFIAPNSSYGQ